MPTGDGLEPGFRGVGTALGVEVSVVLEDSGLGDVPGVVRVLLLQVAVADLVVLGGAEPGRNVGVSADVPGRKLLLAAGTVVVLVSDVRSDSRVRAEEPGARPPAPPLPPITAAAWAREGQRMRLVAVRAGEQARGTSIVARFASP